MNGKQLKNSILQWAIQGKLVPQDPNDEPASVLLERIRAEKARLVKEGKIKKDKNESIIFRGDDNSHYEKFLATGEVKCIDDEIPFEIPKGWEWCRFGSIVIHNPIVTADDETNAAFMPMTLIDAGYGSSYTYETKKWATIKNGFSKIATGDIAYAKITPCFQNRKSFILGDVPGGVAAATTELNVIRTYTGTIEKWYILYFLKSEYFIKEARYKGTAGQQRVLSDYIQNKLFPLPPLNEQKRIVQKIQTILPIIRTYGKSQEALDKLNTEILDKLKLSVLQEAIQGRLVPQNPNDAPATILLERIREEKLRLLKEGKLKKKDITDSVIFKGDDNKYYEKIGNETVCIDEEIPFDIPQSWSWTRLQSICKITNGFTPLRSEDRFWKGGSINWFTVDDIREQGECITETKQRITEEATSEERIVRAGSVLLCCTASIGQCAITRIATTTNQQFNALTIKDEYRDIIDDEYLFIFAKTLKDELNRLAGTTTFAFVSVKKVGNILIPIPPIREQKRIVDIVKKSISSTTR